MPLPQRSEVFLCSSSPRYSWCKWRNLANRPVCPVDLVDHVRGCCCWCWCWTSNRVACSNTRLCFTCVHPSACCAKHLIIYRQMQRCSPLLQVEPFSSWGVLDIACCAGSQHHQQLRHAQGIQPSQGRCWSAQRHSPGRVHRPRRADNSNSW